MGPVLEPVLAGFSAKNDVLTEAPRATWHYYSSVFGVCRCLGQVSHGNRFGTHFGPYFGAYLAPKSAYFFTGAVQDRFQSVLRRLGRPSEGGPKLDPKMDRKKIGRKSKTGQPAILHQAGPKPREGIKGWVNPFLWGLGGLGKLDGRGKWKESRL